MPEPFGAADFPVLLADFGVDVVVGVGSARGLFDARDEEILPGVVDVSVGRRLSVRIVSGSLPGLVIGAGITVAGVGYAVREILQIDDGAFTEVLLRLP